MDGISNNAQQYKARSVVSLCYGEVAKALTEEKLARRMQHGLHPQRTLRTDTQNSSHNGSSLVTPRTLKTYLICGCSWLFVLPASRLPCELSSRSLNR